MSNKVKVRACEFDSDATTIVYRNMLQMGGLNDKEEKKAVNRIVAAFEGVDGFDKEVDDGPCMACGNLKTHFQHKDGFKTIIVPLRDVDRKLIYDKIIEANVKRGAALALKRKLSAIAQILGSKYAALFDGLVEEEQPDEDEEFEVVEDDVEEPAKPAAEPAKA
jgi:hypothetical protein